MALNVTDQDAAREGAGIIWALANGFSNFKYPIIEGLLLDFSATETKP